MFATLTNVTVSNQNIFLSSGLGKGASLSRGEWVWTIIIYLVPTDFMNTIRTELWIHKHPDFFSFIAPLFMCNSIVPTLYRNINPKIIFRKKTVVFIFSLASVDMCILCPDCCSVFMRSSPNQSWVWIILQSSENNEGREASLIVPMVTEYT